MRPTLTGPSLSGSSTLYGTTTGRTWGTIFQINSDGVGFVVLHDFNQGSVGDGHLPLAGPTLSGSTLYGTTRDGGTNGQGTIFSQEITLQSVRVPALAPSTALLVIAFLAGLVACRRLRY